MRRILTTSRRLLLLVVLVTISMIAYADSFTLKGKVIDEDGNPVELATVACMEQGKVSMTSLKGEFSLKLQSADSVIVRFSMIGYKTRTRTFRHPKGTQTLLMTLYPQDELQEVTNPPLCTTRERVRSEFVPIKCRQRRPHRPKRRQLPCAQKIVCCAAKALTKGQSKQHTT